MLSRGGAGPLDFRWLLAQVGVFGPSLAALIVSAVSGRELRRNSLRILPLLGLALAVGFVIALVEPASNIEVGSLAAIMVTLVTIWVVIFFWPLSPKLLLPGTGEAQRPAGGRWLALAFVLPVVLFLLAWTLTGLQSGELGLSSYQSDVAAFGRIVIVSFSINFLFGGSLGEEIGWRGFLLPRLLRRHDPLVASIILGVVWAFWHAPIDLTTGSFGPGPAALLGRFIWTLPVAILFTWFYIKSGGNLLVALILHTSLNISSDFGFSNYERSLVVCMILLFLTTLGLWGFSRMPRTGS
ncbi:MAG: CPBP family intramembrane metalloprotease [Gemmatimonadota bacterium]|nr:MAG: CPBP family intramembrane metalloprotease [Gemmatimonadota bacterium]